MEALRYESAYVLPNEIFVLLSSYNEHKQIFFVSNDLPCDVLVQTLPLIFGQIIDGNKTVHRWPD